MTTGGGRLAHSASRIASIAAPLCVPLLLDLGGSGLVFGVFATFFLVAAAAALALPERRGQALEETAPADELAGRA